MIIYDMKTEDLINPIGIDEKKPRFSWKLQSKISGTVQTAYELLFAPTMIRFGTAVKLRLTAQSALNTTVVFIGYDKVFLASKRMGRTRQ